MAQLLEKKLRLQAKRRGISAEATDEYVLDKMSRRFAWTPEEAKKYKESMKDEQRTAL